MHDHAHEDADGAAGDQWALHADSYLENARAEIPDYDGLQAALAEAADGMDVARVLDLGSGTGMTARAILDRHPQVELVGVDGSDDMLAHARSLVPEATFTVGRLEEELPEGPFDLVVSAFAIHHLDDDAKAALCSSVAEVLRDGGRFVWLDVVVPFEEVERPVPLEEGVDQPNPVEDHVAWLADAGLEPEIVLERGDVAIVIADKPSY